MVRKQAIILGASATLGAFVMAPVTATARVERDTSLRADAASSATSAPRVRAVQIAQNFYPYGGGYYYPPYYYYRQPPADGWGWNGNGWGNTYSGGWRGSHPGNGGGSTTVWGGSLNNNAWGGSGGGLPPPRGGGGRW